MSHFTFNMSLGENLKNTSTRKRQCYSYTEVERNMIVRVFAGISKDFPDWTKQACMEKTCEYTGCGVSTVEKYLRVQQSTGSVKPPKQLRRNSIIHLDEHHKYLIRKTVHSFFLENKMPTVDAVHVEVSKNDEIPSMSRSKLYKVLRELKFRHSKRNRKSMLIERADIITWRRRFLREIKKFRAERRPVFYLDETWINAGHTKNYIWQDETIRSHRQAFNEGLSTGLRNPSGKGKRLIILHIGSENEFLDGGLLLFEGIKTGDYHDEMNAARFEEWFKNMLNKLPPNAVIVMDNASYHSRVKDKIPTSAWKKEDIRKWLASKNIGCGEKLLKAELMYLVTINKPPYKSYVVDGMAQDKDMSVLRLPPYHCELNPIELVWGFIKSDVAANNTTFKFNDMKKLFYDAIQKVTPSQWQKNIGHVIAEEAKMWELDGLMDTAVEELVINLAEDSSSTDFSDSEKEN